VSRSSRRRLRHPSKTPRRPDRMQRDTRGCLTAPGRVGSAQRPSSPSCGVLIRGSATSGSKRFGRQYLRGAWTTVCVTSLLPRPFASRHAAALCQGSRTRRALATGPTPTGPQLRLLLKGPVSVRSRSSARSLPTTSCAWHSLIRLGQAALFDTFVHRPFSPLRDRLLANNFFIFGLPSPDLAKEQPTFFDSRDGVRDGGTVVRAIPRVPRRRSLASSVRRSC
jgi:hypothetical protein